MQTRSGVFEGVADRQVREDLEETPSGKLPSAFDSTETCFGDETP